MKTFVVTFLLQSWLPANILAGSWPTIDVNRRHRLFVVTSVVIICYLLTLVFLVHLVENSLRLSVPPTVENLVDLLSVAVKQREWL